MKYANLFPANKYIRKYIQPLKTLELACGSGKLTEEMRKKGINVICSDILNEPQVDVVHDLNKPFPWKSNEFEQVICVDSLELIDNPNNVLSETNRVLNKKGFFILTVPRSFFYFNSKSNHKNYFTPSSIEFMIKQNNFKIIGKNHFYFVPYLKKTLKVPTSLIASHLVYFLQKK
jgi:SAM-dependent methyltransferase